MELIKQPRLSRKVEHLRVVNRLRVARPLVTDAWPNKNMKNSNYPSYIGERPKQAIFESGPLTLSSVIINAWVGQDSCWFY